MEIKREWLEELIFEGVASRRYTQDSPVLPDVWIRYGKLLTRGEPPVLDLLLTPHSDSTAGQLHDALVERLEYERRARGHWATIRTPRGYLTTLLAAAKENALTEARDEGEDEMRCDPREANPAFNQSTVAACLHLEEVIRILLPFTGWWRKNVCGDANSIANADIDTPEGRERIDSGLAEIKKADWRTTGPSDLVWLVRLVGGMLAAAREPDPAAKSWEARKARWRELVSSDNIDSLVSEFRRFVLGPVRPGSPCPDLPHVAPLFMVSRNRRATAPVYYSVQAMKADAARRVFTASCAGLAWAILDSGIDATHPAFRRRADHDGRKEVPLPSPFEADMKGKVGNGTRVEATFDFTRIRALLSGSRTAIDEVIAGIKAKQAEAEAALQGMKDHKGGDDAAATAHLKKRVQVLKERLEDWEAYGKKGSAATRSQNLRRSLSTGRVIDWDELRPLIEVDHVEGIYVAPTHEHGTHVAGILASDWRSTDWEAEKDGRQNPEHTKEDVQGVCPDIRLFDFRVFADDGSGDEFSVMAAMQFLRHLNAHRELPLIHGANLSLAIRHDVANYACGRTPVCEEAERVVNAGVVVVAAAGNYGFQRFSTLTDSGAASSFEGYADISITDPGNADSVITVGSTHRMEPHTYGVSYFSSRGPTGDGRYKPDLVAPGEKIKSPVPNCGLKVKDGTSMAAPHVSGAAALILARYREFVGRPQRVKQILCSTATDLGRDRYFQGAGMVDVLRALQSV